MKNGEVCDDGKSCKNKCKNDCNCVSPYIQDSLAHCSGDCCHQYNVKSEKLNTGTCKVGKLKVKIGAWCVPWMVQIIELLREIVKDYRAERIDNAIVVDDLKEQLAIKNDDVNVLESELSMRSKDDNSELMDGFTKYYVNTKEIE